MANKAVNLIRSFGYTDGEGKEWYFTRSNQDQILDVVGEANLKPYIENGVVELMDTLDPAEEKAAFGNRFDKGIRPSNAGTNAASTSRASRPAPKET